MGERDKTQAALTVHELAERVGMTVRNLREWQTLGLVPHPEVRGRTGYYEPAVVARIEEIQRLRGQGFPLELIRRMLDASGDAGVEVMQLARALRAPFREPDAPTMERAEWESSWGTSDPAHLARAVDLGLVRERDDGTLQFANARIARVGETLRAIGLAPDEILDATARIREHLDRIAALFEQVWLDHIWEPFVEAGMPEDQLAGLQATLAEVQPLAMEAVAGLFTVAMEHQIEQGIAREVARAAERTDP